MLIALCQTCDNPTPRLVKSQKKTGLLRCFRCRSKSWKYSLQKCSICGEEKKLQVRNPPICQSCYPKSEYHERHKKKCFGCEKFRIVAKIIPEGPLCHTCRYRHKHGLPLGVPLRMGPLPQPNRKRASKKVVPLIVPSDHQSQWCVDCQGIRPKVVIYGDKQGRCPVHGIAYLRAKKLASA